MQSTKGSGWNTPIAGKPEDEINSEDELSNGVCSNIRIIISKSNGDITLSLRAKIGLAYPDEVIKYIGERLQCVLPDARHIFRYGRYGEIVYFDENEHVGEWEVYEKDGRRV